MDAIGISAGGRYLQATGQADYASAQVVAIGSGVTQTTAFAALNTVVILRANVACWFRVGGTAAAHTAGSDYLPANTAWMVKIAPGAVLSFIQDTVGGYVAVVPMTQPNPTGAPPPLLLDTVAPTVAACSFRRLTNAYAGPAVNVLRTSDSATQDIGFNGNDFDTAGFSAFIGASTGHLNIWYDQSGHGFNLISGGSTSPIISLTAAGGRPTAAFLTTDTLHHATTSASSQPFTFSAVAARTGAFTTFGGIIGDDDGQWAGLYFDQIANSVAVFAGGATVGSGLTVADNAFHSLVAVINAAASTVTADGVTSAPLATGTNTYIGLKIGSVGPYPLTASVSEGIFWNGVLGASDIAKVSSSQTGYF